MWKGWRAYFLSMVGVLVAAFWWMRKRRSSLHNDGSAVQGTSQQLVAADSNEGEDAKADVKQMAIMGPLRERLTVILTTSPIYRHPSTELIDEVLGSMQLAQGTSSCDMVIVCDGYRRENGEGVVYTESKYRSGIVDATSAANYDQYKMRLRSRARTATAATPAVKVLELDSRHGFGFAVRAALEHVRTPYVLVMQHDRPFMRPVDIAQIVTAMEADPLQRKYIGLPTSTTIGHPYHVLSKYGLYIEPFNADDNGLQLVPLIQWYDSAHVCEVEYYRSFVFGPRRLVARGGFIEDKFGQAQLADIRKRGVAVAHPEYGTFIAAGIGFDKPCVGHLDGRDEQNTKHFKFVKRVDG